jgi:hypothetical protein
MNAALYWYLRHAVGAEGLSRELTEGMNEALDEIESRVPRNVLEDAKPADFDKGHGHRVIRDHFPKLTRELDEMKQRLEP